MEYNAYMNERLAKKNTTRESILSKKNEDPKKYHEIVARRMIDDSYEAS